MFGNLIFCFLNFVFICNAYKILVVFPINGKSHSILGEGFVKILLNGGHEVTYITPFPEKNVSFGLRQIDVSSNTALMPTEEIMNIEKIMTKEVDLWDISKLLQMTHGVAKATLLHNSVQQLMFDPEERFDVVIAEWMYSELYAGLASVFECPLIWSSSMDPHYLVMSLIDEDLNPSYTADVYTNDSPPFTFTQRVAKLWSYIETRFKKWTMSSFDQEAYEQAYSSAISRKGRILPPFEEVIHNGSLMFGNSHVSAGQSIRLPQNYIPIAGYHIENKVKELPMNLKKILDDAKHGVIYFSMGSMLKSKDIPHEIKKGLLEVFSNLKQTIIWKFEDPLENIPKNVHIVNWAPQQSVLAHPNCVLFITHGGLLSTTEALHFGVPIIGIPMFADQFNNVNRAVAKGFAKRVDLDFQTPDNLKAAIEEILTHTRYRERVKELSFVYHHRRATPAAEILHWVDHVVRTRGALHLRSPALMVPWYQKSYLDLAAIITLVLIVTFMCIRTVLCSRKENKFDLSKKEK